MVAHALWLESGLAAPGRALHHFLVTGGAAVPFSPFSWVRFRRPRRPRACRPACDCSTRVAVCAPSVEASKIAFDASGSVRGGVAQVSEPSGTTEGPRLSAIAFVKAEFLHYSGPGDVIGGACGRRSVPGSRAAVRRSEQGHRRARQGPPSSPLIIDSVRETKRHVDSEAREEEARHIHEMNPTVSIIPPQLPRRPAHERSCRRIPVWQACAPGPRSQSSTTPLAPVPRADAQPKTLVVTGYGGRWSEVMKKALVEPFEKTHGVKVEVVTGITTEWVAKLMAAGPDNPPYDVVFGNEPAFPIPRERGFFDKRNETLAPNIKNLYPKALIGDTSLAMFWGASASPTAPTPASRSRRAGRTSGTRRTRASGRRTSSAIRSASTSSSSSRRSSARTTSTSTPGSPAIQAGPAEARGLLRHHREAARAEGGRHRGAPRRGLPRSPEARHPGGLGRRRARASRSSTRSSRSRAARRTRSWRGSSSTPISRPRSSSPSPPSSSGARPTRRSRYPRTWRRRSSTAPADVDKLVLFDWAQVAKQRPQWTEKWNKEMR